MLVLVKVAFLGCLQPKLSSVLSVLWCRTSWLSLIGVSAAVSAASLEESSVGSAAATSARVVKVDDSRATATYVPRQEVVDRMVERGLSSLWNTPTPDLGWRALISPSDVVGIRVHSSAGKTSGTRPQVVSAVARSLIASGHPRNQIIVWDRQLSSLRAAGYFSLRESLGIQVLGARDLGYDSEAFYESSLIGTMIWGDHEFGQTGEGIGRKSYVSKLLSEKIDKIISLSPLLNHNLAGVNGNLFGLAMASVDNTIRFQSGPDRLAVAIPEINAVPEIGDHVVLSITDALIAQYQGQSQARLQDSVVLNELWFSADPVALDTLALNKLDELRTERGIDFIFKDRSIYQNASLLQLGMSDPEQIQVHRVSLP